MTIGPDTTALDERDRRCPTCGAHRSAAVVCHRCKSDLTKLVRIELQAERLLVNAGQLYSRGLYRRAAVTADRSYSLEASPQCLRLVVCSHLMSGDFRAAWTAALRGGYHAHAIR